MTFFTDSDFRTGRNPVLRTHPAGSHLSDGDADFRDGPGLQASFGERGCRPRFPEATSPTDRLSDETIRQVRRTGKHPAKDIFRDRFGKSSGSDRRHSRSAFPATREAGLRSGKAGPFATTDGNGPSLDRR